VGIELGSNEGNIDGPEEGKGALVGGKVKPSQ